MLEGMRIAAIVGVIFFGIIAIGGLFARGIGSAWLPALIAYLLWSKVITQPRPSQT